MDTLAFIDQYLAGYTPYKTYWNYEDGCVLLGCIQLYAATENEKYKRFVLDYVNGLVNDQGVITNYETEQYNIDTINCSKTLFFAYEQTKDEKYRKAIEFTMDRLRHHPRCKCGNFWHKTLYPNQIWLDGLYMAQPFYMMYETAFDQKAKYQDIVEQFKNVRKYLYNDQKKLYYHAYDEARVQPWADKETGCSPNFWLRSMGWYLMALVDTLSYTSETIYEAYRALADLLKEAIHGILNYRDAQTGLFYQVIDHQQTAGNYTETSGSAMIGYAILKACSLGVLNREKYEHIGLEIVESLIKNKLTMVDGKTELRDICWVAGLGPGEKRDGSVAYYLSEKIVSNDSKGVGPFMMAYAQYLTCRQA